MVSKDDDKLVIWPVYFDKLVTKKSGRKISKKLAVEKPSIDKILKASKSLGFNPVLENDKSYPSRHWKKEGRILIDKKGSKTKILNQIASRLS